MKRLKLIGIVICLFIPSLIIYFSTESLIKISGNSINKIEPNGNYFVSTKIVDTKVDGGACISQVVTICIEDKETGNKYCGGALLNSNEVKNLEVGATVNNTFYYEVTKTVTLLFLSLTIAICNIVNVILFLYILKFIISNRKNLTIDT